jgi:hypothetical protein
MRECNGVGVRVEDVIAIGADGGVVVAGGITAGGEEGSLGIVTLFSQ